MGRGSGLLRHHLRNCQKIISEPHRREHDRGRIIGPVRTSVPASIIGEDTSVFGEVGKKREARSGRKSAAVCKQNGWPVPAADKFINRQDCAVGGACSIRRQVSTGMDRCMLAMRSIQTTLMSAFRPHASIRLGRPFSISLNGMAAHCRCQSTVPPHSRAS